MATIHLLKTISLIPLLLLLLDPVSVSGDNNILHSSQKLSPGASLKNGAYSLVMQRSCNLVLYDSGEAIWSTNTAGKSSNCYCIMQTDGNLVVYTPDVKSIWSSNTHQGGTNTYVLVLQNDRNLAIYGPGKWDLGTTLRAPGVTIGKGKVNINGANHTMAGQKDTETKA